MKRALLLTYYMPPRASIASVRAWNIITALREFNWDVVPVVPDVPFVEYPPNVRTTSTMDFREPVRRLFGVQSDETTHSRLGVEPVSPFATQRSWKQRAITFGHRVMTFANGRFGWYVPGTQAVGEMLRAERFNAIISTSPPEGTHIVASRVHGDIPWIADLRDPWLRNDDLGMPGLLGAMDRMLEPRVLRDACALTTVSEPLAQALRGRYPGKEVLAIPNAFSHREWEAVPFEHPNKATFLHAGQLYGGRCDPRPFFEALAYLLQENLVSHDEVRVDLYGDDEPWLEALVARYALRRVVKLHGRRPRAEILRLERCASRLVIFVRNGPDERGTYTGKLFEYLGARRPIIAVGGPQETTVMDEALAQSGAGTRYCSHRALRDGILDAVKEWRTGQTTIVPRAAVDPFEVQHLGQRFAELLERAAAPRSVPVAVPRGLRSVT